MNKLPLVKLPNGTIIAIGVSYQIKSVHNEISTGYCYEHPDLDRGTIGLGFNTADGGGFLPHWDISKESAVYMTFGQAVDAAKKGYHVARTGWNGKGMFAYIQPAHTVESTPSEMEAFGAYKYYRESWMLKTAQGDIATWSPSGSDSMAEDWVIVIHDAA